MRYPKSYLFVPGQRADRFQKAASAGADAIILDLEDAVGPEFKNSARDDVAGWFAGGGQGIVRINGQDTPWFEDDLAMLADAGCDGVMVPKAAPESLNAVAGRLPSVPLIALIETVHGLAAARESAAAKGVFRLAFGNLDFSTDARITDAGIVLDPARFELVMASRLGDLPPPIDGVTTEIKDTDFIADDAEHAAAIGFGGKLCIHPAQIAPVNTAFSPSAAQIDWATRVIAALEAAAGSAVQVDGKMIDRPLIDRARQILGR